MHLQDLRYAIRALKKSPGFTLAAVLMLALGIGVNAAVFAITNAVLFKGFRLVQDNDRLLYIGMEGPCCVSYRDFEDWRSQASSFKGMAVVHGKGLTLGDERAWPERHDGTEVSADTFRIVGVQPMLGRDFSASDETPGAPPVAIISHRFWEQRYRSDPAVVGRAVRIDGIPTTIIGVMPSGFSFPQNQDVWVPLVRSPDARAREARDLWFAFGRLADEATVETARAELETIGRRLAATNPKANAGMRPDVRTFNEFFIGRNENLIYASTWGAVGFVLLIACANLANLMLSRAMGRAHEISIRVALGAGRWQIARQLIVESVLLSSIGGLFGWWVATWGVRTYALLERGPGLSPWRVLDYTMDYRTLAYMVVMSVFTGMLFGIGPAIRLSRADVYGALREGGRGATGGVRRRRLSGLLVTGEVALAVVLLAGAAVMARSFVNVSAANLGIDPSHSITALVQLPDAKYPNASLRNAFRDRLNDRIEAIPGVESVAFASQLPTWPVRRIAYELEGDAPVDIQRRRMVSALIVSPSYFRTLGTGLVSGRDFNEADGASGLSVAIVNRMFARLHWQGADPLGKRLRMFDGQPESGWVTVVGVAPDIVQNDPTRQALEPLVYVPSRQRPVAAMWLIARTHLPSADIATTLRHEIQALDADLPIWLGPFSLAERLEEVYWNKRLYAGLFVILAAVALLLASIGVYAVVACSVRERTQEFGIRMTMGATPRDVLALVFRSEIVQVGIGLAIGLVAALAVNRLLEAELVQVSSSDPIALIVACATLLASAALGCLLPALGATRVDPLVAVKGE
jgi:putative ABC transport system permease protein